MKSTLLPWILSAGAVAGLAYLGRHAAAPPGPAPVPAPGPGQVLVEVVAAGVNQPDCIQRAGLYPPPPGETQIPGLEIAGEVVAVGSGATRHRPGDKVMSLVAGGGYAEYCIAQDAQAMKVPAAYSMLEAGATPETLMTVWHNVFERGGLKSGETLLVHGGSSGIGTACGCGQFEPQRQRSSAAAAKRRASAAAFGKRGPPGSPSRGTRGSPTSW